MRVKSFTAESMNEAMALVKKDLGRDAVILHTRRFRKGGVWGFFAREMVEVMAAVDTPIAAAVEKKLPPPPPVPLQQEEEGKFSELKSEIAGIRTMVEQVLCKLPQQEKHAPALLELLTRNDVDAQVAEKLLESLPIVEKSLIDKEPILARKMLFEQVLNCLGKAYGISIPATGCKVVALIGPTGVGKTTTIAKLAANFALKEGYKVALITADTYRIAAVEQLKTYADILGVPIEVVYTADELKASLYRYNDKNLVLIDTAGRSPRNLDQLSELQALLAVVPNMETHLVLSATTKYKDALEIVNRFAICSPQRFLFTKIDEATSLGTILNLMYQFPAAMSYVTTGQSVPEDIEIADPTKLANLILRD